MTTVGRSKERWHGSNHSGTASTASLPAKRSAAPRHELLPLNRLCDSVLVDVASLTPARHHRTSYRWTIAASGSQAKLRFSLQQKPLTWMRSLFPKRAPLMLHDVDRR